MFLTDKCQELWKENVTNDSFHEEDIVWKNIINIFKYI